MKSLPTLRRKILRSFSVIISLYAILGVLLMISVNISSNTTPKLLHVNYDSISAANRMDEAWTALQFPRYSSLRSREAWIQEFDEAIQFEQSNITEPGEKEVAHQVQSKWEDARSQLGSLSPAQFESMKVYLSELVTINEKGMFGFAQQNEQLSRRVLVGTLVYFFLSLVLSVFFADNLAQRLSRPLKSIAEALHRRPGVDRKLKLPEPTNLEVLILTSELERLWERLSSADRLNVAEILNQKNKLEALLGSVEDGLLVLDHQGMVSHCNDYLGTLIGLPMEQVLGHPWGDLPAANENYLKLREALRKDMPESLQVDLMWNKSLCYFSARSRPIESPGKANSGTLFLLHDITEKKQREKFRSDFIDLLSHELKTPLQSLGTASELLTGMKAGFHEDAQVLIDTVSEDVERIKAVAQEFVQITQSQSKIMKLRLDLVALNQVLPEWIKPFGVFAKDRGVRIELKQEGSEVIWARLDLVKFPWIVSNLLSNAIRFSPKSGVVTVLLTDRSSAIEVRIRDEGPGIPESERGKIFEPFYQSALNTSSGTRGLFGIGLTIAKEVVEAHDGRIEYHGLQPHGSEFRVLLPFPPLQYGQTENEGKRESKSWTH